MPVQLLLFSFFTGITVFIGGLLAKFFDHHMPDTPVKFQVVHTMMSFGIGIILSAIALVLIPKGLHELSLLGIIIAFVAGTILFMLIDIQLAKAKGKMATLLAVFTGRQTCPKLLMRFVVWQPVAGTQTKCWASFLY